MLLFCAQLTFWHVLLKRFWWVADITAVWIYHSSLHIYTDHLQRENYWQVKWVTLIISTKTQYFVVSLGSWHSCWKTLTHLQTESSRLLYGTKKKERKKKKGIKLHQNSKIWLLDLFVHAFTRNVHAYLHICTDQDLLLLGFFFVFF